MPILVTVSLNLLDWKLLNAVAFYSDLKNFWLYKTNSDSDWDWSSNIEYPNSARKLTQGLKLL